MAPLVPPAQYRKFETNIPDCAASVPISIFTYLSAIYIFPRLPILLQENMWADPGNI